MLVCDERKLVFIHIPKTAGVSVSEALGFGAGPRTARHAVKSDVATVYKDYLRACFVRNPWERAYSAFRYSKRMTEAGEINGQAPRLYLETRPEADFRTFTADFLKTADVSKILHFREQMHWILRGQPQFIGRVERLAEDVATLSRFLGGPVELGRLNAAPEAERLADVYDAETRATIGEIYRRDARFLNYRFPADDR